MFRLTRKKKEQVWSWGGEGTEGEIGPKTGPRAADQKCEGLVRSPPSRLATFTFRQSVCRGREMEGLIWKSSWWTIARAGRDGVQARD